VVYSLQSIAKRKMVQLLKEGEGARPQPLEKYTPSANRRHGQRSRKFTNGLPYIEECWLSS